METIESCLNWKVSCSLGRRFEMKKFTLEYWQDDEWYVGRLKEVPSVFSQGETLEELEENIRDAYRLMMEDDTDFFPHVHAPVHQKEIGVDI